MSFVFLWTVQAILIVAFFRLDQYGSPGLAVQLSKHLGCTRAGSCWRPYIPNISKHLLTEFHYCFIFQRGLLWIQNDGMWQPVWFFIVCASSSDVFSSDPSMKFQRWRMIPISWISSPFRTEINSGLIGIYFRAAESRFCRLWLHTNCQKLCLDGIDTFCLAPQNSDDLWDLCQNFVKTCEIWEKFDKTEIPWDTSTARRWDDSRPINLRIYRWKQISRLSPNQTRVNWTSWLQVTWHSKVTNCTLACLLWTRDDKRIYTYLYAGFLCASLPLEVLGASHSEAFPTFRRPTRPSLGPKLQRDPFFLYCLGTVLIPWVHRNHKVRGDVL